MPNSIKYSTTGDTLSIKKGNFFFGVGDVGKGPSSTSGHYQGISPPSNGYTIYGNTSGNNTAIFCANNNTQLINFTNGFYFSVTNYISNGGNFANGTISPFTGSYNDAGGVGQVTSIVNNLPYTNSQSQNAMYLNYNGGRILSTVGLLTTGVTYTFSFWAKIISGSSFSVSWNNQNGSGDTNAWTSSASLTTQWQRYTQTFTYNVAKNNFYFYSRSADTTRAAIFTEFQVTTGSTYGPPSLQNETECLRWYGAVPSNLVCVNRDYEPISTNGLILNLDAGFTPSYPTTGTTWYDISYGGNNGTLINGPTFNPANGGSIVFDGVDDFGRLPANNGLQPSAELTLEVWFKSSGSNSRIQGLLYLNYGTGLRLETNGAIHTRINSAGSLQTFTTTSTYFNNLWNQVILTINSNTAILYVNSTLVSQYSIVYNGSSPFDTSIGGVGTDSNDSANRGFYGNLSIARVYNKVLTQTEILQNFNAQKSRFGL